MTWLDSLESKHEKLSKEKALSGLFAVVLALDLSSFLIASGIGALDV